MSWKKRLYRESKNFISRKLYELHSKPFFTHKNFFCTYLSSLSAKISHFYKPKAFLSHKPFLLPSKATLFCPPPPFLTTLNLLFAKNTAVLLLFALILCCKAGASHRFKSLPAIPGKCSFQHSRLLDERRSFQKKSRIDRRFESRSQDGVPRAFWLLFARCKKWQPVLPRRKLRGSANLESAHSSCSFTPQQLKPFKEALRFCKPRISTPQWHLRTATIKTFIRELLKKSKSSY